MTPTPDAVDGTRARAGRSRPVKRTLAATVTAAMAITGLSVLGAQSANADTPQRRTQAAASFLDGTIGNQPIQDLVKLKGVTATSWGSSSVQNPLDATVLRKLNLPLTGALQLPELFKTIAVGAANQVAVAHTDGYSYGASGAVSNQGGVSIGGQTGVPDAANIDLSVGSLGGQLPGNLGSLLGDLGSIKLSVGAVSALAQTKSGGDAVAPNYHIAGLKLQIGSTALAGLLDPVTSAVGSLVDSLSGALGSLTGSQQHSCSLVEDFGTLNLANGAVVLDASSGGLVIDIQKLLDTLGLNLNDLPANTDLIDVVLDYLTSPDGLVAGLSSVLNSLAAPLTDCASALGVVGNILDKLLGTANKAATSITDALSGLLAKLGADNPLSPLSSALKQLVDIGVNVQTGPGAAATNAKFPFTSQLKATTDQSAPVVKGQTIVRAVEINLVGDPLATLALANAAAGPSTLAPPTSPTTSPNNGGSSTPNGGPSGSTSSNTNGNGQPAGPNGGGNGQVPNGVPAGMATTGGAPALPLLLLAIGLVLAGGGVAAWKFRGVRAH